MRVNVEADPAPFGESSTNSFLPFGIEEAPITSLMVCEAPDGLSTEILNAFTVRVQWNAVIGAESYNLRYRVQGLTVWTTLTGLQVEGQLLNISPTTYEWEVQAVCDDDDQDEVSIWVPGPVLNAQCDLPVGMTVGTIAATSAELSWNAEPTPLGSELRYRVVGAAVWTILSVGNNSTINLSNLVENNTYEWQVRTDCGSGNITEWVAGNNFTTVNNACEAPDNLTVGNRSGTSAQPRWDAVTGAAGYELRYRPVGSTEWSTLQLPGSLVLITLQNLSLTTEYEWEIRTDCGGTFSPWAIGPNFSTECTDPTGHTVTEITDTSALLSWNAIEGVPSYELRYRITASGGWTFQNVTDNSFALSTLTESSNYEWQVRANCPNGTSNYIAGPFFETQGEECPGPNALIATNISFSSVDLSWDPAPGISSYEIRYRVTASGPWDVFLTVEGTSISVTQLDTFTNYEWQVRTLCPNSESEWKAGPFFRTLGETCDAPTNPLVSGTSTTSAAFTWEPVSGVDNYEIRYRITGTSTWTTVPFTGNTALINGLTPNTNYEWQVSTVCAQGASEWVAGDFFSTINTPCTNPSDLEIEIPTLTTAVLSWRDIPGVFGYTFRYRIVGSPIWTTLQVADSTISLGGLITGSDYEWQVQTNCGINTSEWVIGEIFTAGATPCPAPADLTVGNLAINSASFSWATANGAQDYEIRYRVKSTTTWTVVTESSTSLDVSELLPETLYEWEVRTNCEFNSSEWAVGPDFQTLAITCPNPGNLAVSAVQSSSASLSWDAVAEATKYLVRYRLVGSATWVEDSVDNNSLLLENLQSESSYEWEVKTICGEGESEWISGGVIQTLFSCPIPANLAVLNITALTAEIRWDAPSPIEGVTYTYFVRYRPVGDTVWITETKNVNSSILSKLIPETAYEWEVQTNCGGGNVSEWLQGPNFTTDNAPCEDPSGLRVFDVSQDSASFSWNSIPNAIEYQFRYREANSELWIIITVQDTTITLLDLVVATAYNWSVRADCGEDISQWVPGDDFSTETVPCEPPSALMVDSLTNTMAYVSWVGYENATLYRVRYRVAGTEVWTTIETGDLTSVFSNLLANTEYQWAAQSECGSIPTEWVLGPNFTTNENPEPCDAPTGLEVLDTTEIQATVRWIGGTGIDSFRVRYRILGTTQWQVINSPDTLAILNNLTDGSTYQWEVQSICGELFSSWSEGENFTTVDIPIDCGLPADLTVAQVRSNSANLLWTGVTVSSAYEVRYKPISQGIWDTTKVFISGAQLEDLLSFESYEWEVRTLCVGDTSAWIAGPQFRTQARPFVELLQPSDSTFIPEGGSAILEALASDEDSDTVLVAIYVNDSLFIEGETLVGTQWEDIPQGLYSIYAIATDSDGNKDTSEVSRLFVGFDVNNLLVSDFVTFGSELCFLDSAQVIFGDASIGAKNYSWDFGEDAFPQTADSIGPHVVKYASPGLKTVQLIVRDSLGNENIRIKTIEVFIQPPIGDGGMDRLVCEGQDSVLLSATQVEGFNGSWRLASGVGLILSPDSSTTWVQSLGTGENVFFWELTNGACVSDPDTVRVIRGSCIPSLNGDIFGADTLCTFDIGTTYFVEEDSLVDEYVWTLPPGFEGNVDGNTLTLTQIGGSGGLITVYAQNEFGISPTLGRDIFVEDCSSAFQLITFTAYEEAEEIWVDWVAENEEEIQTYTIERSLDSLQFSEINSLDPLRDGEKRHRYIQPDQIQTGGGVYYYRIRMETADGRVFYSEVVRLEINGLESLISIAITPNPIVENTITLQVEVLRSGILEIETYDGLGRTLFIGQVEVNTGLNRISFEEYDLAPGVYFMRLQKSSNGKSEVLKFIKR